MPGGDLLRACVRGLGEDDKASLSTSLMGTWGAGTVASHTEGMKRTGNRKLVSANYLTSHNHPAF